VTWVSMMISLEDCVVLIQWEPPTHDRGTGFVQELHVELGMRTRHVVQGSGTVSFRME
jgi:hypothetical protein